MTATLSLLPRFKELRIAVLGDVMLDVYEYCRTAASKPIPSEQPGCRAYFDVDRSTALGGAGNVAANLADLGVATVLAGLVGDDGDAGTVARCACDHGIETRLVTDPGRPTTTKARIYVDGTYQLRRDHESVAPAAAALEEALANALAGDMAGFDALILSDYAKGALTRPLSRRLLDAAVAAGVPVIVDCKPPHADWFAGAEIVAPNDLEADILLPGFLASLDKRRYNAALHRRFGARNTVVTLGGNGICGWDGTAYHYIEAHPIDVVDAVGAGDTVRAAMALGSALRLPLPDILALANDIAAVSVQKAGTATVSPDDQIRFLNRDRGAERRAARD